jgi:hypothetical protein
MHIFENLYLSCKWPVMTEYKFWGCAICTLSHLNRFCYFEDMPLSHLPEFSLLGGLMNVKSLNAFFSDFFNAFGFSRRLHGNSSYY